MQLNLDSFQLNSISFTLKESLWNWANAEEDLLYISLLKWSKASLHFMGKKGKLKRKWMNPFLIFAQLGYRFGVILSLNIFLQYFCFNQKEDGVGAFCWYRHRKWRAACLRKRMLKELENVSVEAIGKCLVSIVSWILTFFSDFICSDIIH